MKNSQNQETKTVINKKPKSFARELAVIILCFWSYAVMNLDSETISAITPWVFIYALGAFGLDKYGKQIKDGKLPDE